VARHLTVGEHSVGIDGLALLRLHRASDAAAADEVLSEMRRLLARLDEPELNKDSRRDPLDVLDGYRRWAAVYDLPGNPVVVHEQPVVWELLDHSGGEPVLDAACGTGRHLTHVAEGGRVGIGVDVSEAMLAVARNKLPGGDLRSGELLRLPLEDEDVAGAVCALALEHVKDLWGAYAELAQVVRRDGWVIVSTVHPAIALIGWHAWFVDQDGRADVVTYAHSISDHVHAAKAAGLRLVDCHEPEIGPGEVQSAAPRSAAIGGPIAMEGYPVVLVLKFERP
jgi:SAM-dependent methyltransferase